MFYIFFLIFANFAVAEVKPQTQKMVDQSVEDVLNKYDPAKSAAQNALTKAKEDERKKLEEKAAQEEQKKAKLKQSEEQEYAQEYAILPRIEARRPYNYMTKASPLLVNIDKTKNTHIPILLPNSYYSSLLFVAAAKNNVLLLQSLLSRGVDINVQSASGNTPAMQAVRNNANAVLLHMLSNGAEITEDLISTARAAKNTDAISMIESFRR